MPLNLNSKLKPELSLVQELKQNTVLWQTMV